MDNEQYLIVSYFIVGITAVGVALATYFWLRPSLRGTIQFLPYKKFIQILKKLFPIGILLPALLGFFSVSFRSCSKDIYEEIIAKRAYLVAKNQEQFSSIFSYITIAVFVWGIIITGVICLFRDTKNRK